MEQNTKRILTFLAITFGITYLYEIAVVRPLVYSEDVMMQSIGSAILSLAMFVPAIGVVLTRLITKEGFKNCWLVPKNFKKTWKYYVIGYFAPSLLTLLGMAVYFVIFPDKLDMNMGYLVSVYAAQGLEMEPQVLMVTLIAQIVMAIFLGAILNCITCFGEEWGWRGYLLPKMKEKMPMLPMLLVTGVIWGLWHAPLTCMGHNYGIDYTGYPVTGILAMCGFCIVMGIIFSYITLRSGSCIPAILAHGALNSIASTGIYFTSDGGNPFIGPAPTGIVGGIGFIVVAVVMAIALVKKPESYVEGLGKGVENNG